MVSAGTFRAPQLGLPYIPAAPQRVPCPPTIRRRLDELRAEFAARVEAARREGRL